MFEVKKIADEYFTYVTECKDPKACTVVLRGGSKDVLNEIERNLLDAMCVARNVIISPTLVCGGGAIEMALSQALMEKSKSIEGIAQQPYQAVAQALEVIPRTLLVSLYQTNNFDLLLERDALFSSVSTVVTMYFRRTVG